MSGPVPIGPWDLALSTTLILVVGLLSLVLKLRLERTILIAAVRSVVQLLLIGYVLHWVFAIEHPAMVAGVCVIMFVAAGRAAVGRSKRIFKGAHVDAFATLVLSGVIVTFTVTRLIVDVTPWYRPQYFIPLLGMVLGNCLTGISLCLDTLLESLSRDRDRVEAELSMGATRWEAARDPLRDATRKGMIPILNTMMVVGIVSLPGMMTGQILAGVDPVDAVTYQIVVMFMVSAGTALGCILLALLVYRRMFNARHQLRSELIRER